MRSSNFGERVTKGFAWTHLYKFAEYGLINLYNVLVIRHFGPELVGPYALYLSAGTVLSLVGAFAVDGVLLRFTSHAFDENEQKDERLRDPKRFVQQLLAFRLLTVTAIVSLLAFGLTIAAVFTPGLIDEASAIWTLAPYVAAFLFFQAVVAFSTSTMMGMLEAKSVFVSSVIARSVLILVGFTVFASDSLTLERAVQIHLVTTALHAAMLFIAMKRFVGEKAGISRHWLRDIGKQAVELVRSRKALMAFVASPVIMYGVTTWGTDILSTVLSRQPDVLMLTAILGENSAQVGYYQVSAMVLLLAEYAMLFGFGGTLVAAFSSLSREDELQHAGSAYPRLAGARRRVFGFHLAAATPLLVYFFFYASPFVSVVFGESFMPAVAAIQWGMIALIVAVGVIGGGMHVTSLVSIGRQRTVFNVRLGWGIANLIGNYFLIRWLGALGAILGTQLANLGACAFEAYIADRKIGPSRDLRAVLTLVSLSVASVGLSWLLFTATGISGIALLLGGGVMSALLYVGVAILIRQRDVIGILDRLSLAFMKRPFPVAVGSKEVAL